VRGALRSAVATSALLAAVAVSAIAGGCGSAPAKPPPTAPDKPQATSTSHYDPCADSKPLTRKYTGILAKARCDQELYLTMADIAGSLDVSCDYCHAHDKSGDPKKFDFPLMTDRKQVALFMQHEFVEGLKTKDGSPVECASCHVDKNGQPAAKFLGEPRDTAYAVEWMNIVMVNKFTHLDGAKLKCKDCHVGNFATPDFKPKVIMQGDQIKLHGVTPFSLAPETPPAVGTPPPCKPKVRPQTAPPLPGRHASAEPLPHAVDG
jgi:hypothetical protein